MAKFKPYFELSIPKEYSPEERRAIAAEIIDYVVNRSEQGLGVGGKSFPKYSKKYAEEKGQTNVDLTFSGDMLNEIRLLNQKNGLIRIGYDSDSDIVGKVEGNVLGTYGNDAPLRGKKRNFLGLTRAELNSILESYPIDDRDERRARVEDLKAADIVARDILDRSGFEAEDE